MFKTKCRVVRHSCYRVSMAMLALWGVTSCIDSRYDLNGDIDMSINVGGEHFAIPVGETEQVMLGKVIKTDDSDMLEVVGNEYHLVKKDVMSGASVKVESIGVDLIETSIDQIAVATEENIPPTGEDFVKADISQRGGFEMKAENIDEAVISIKSFSASAESNLIIRFEAAGNLGYDKITLSRVVVKLPEFLVFTDANLNQTHELVLENEEDANGIFEKVLKVTGYDFSSQNDGLGLQVENGQVALVGEVEVTGAVRVANLHGTGKLNLRPEVTLEAMQIASVEGNIEPDFNMVPTRVELNDIPDFLADDEVQLDVLNPVFKFVAGNPLNTDVWAEGVLTPSRKDGTDLTANQVKISGIRLPANSDKVEIAVVRQEGTQIEGADQIIVVPELSNLIRTIPDFVEVDLSPSVEQGATYSIDLGRIYEIKDPTYDMDIPLSFGEGLHILYNDSITGLGKEMDDIEFKAANIELTAHNTIPLKLEIKSENVVSKDTLGNEIDGIEVAVEGIIAESADGETASESKLVIKMTEKVAGAVKKLDRIDFKVTAVPGSAAGVPLKDNQWFQLTDMKLSIPGGIKIDMN